MTWLAVYSRPNTERSVSDRIRKDAPSRPVFFPFIRDVRRVRRFNKSRLVTTETALFTRYLFVQAEPYWVWYLKTIPEVLAVVSIRGEPLEIPDKVIAAIQAMADPDGCVQDNDFTKAQKAKFKIGDYVRINWPDRILDGFLVQLASIGQREVTVYVNMLGSEREVRVPANRITTAAVVG